MLKDLYILGTVLILGFIYYKLSTSRLNDTKNIAFSIKIMLLAMSFILAFVNCDYIIIGEYLSFGGRTSVMLVILIEIVDAFVDKKKKE